MAEKEKLSPLTLVVSAAAAVTSMVVGSLFGDAGTIWGVALGSVVSGASATWYKNWTLTAHAKVKARKALAAEQHRKNDGTLMGRVLTRENGEQLFIGAHVRRDMRQQGWGWKRQLGFAAALIFVCLSAGIVTLTAVETATGQTLHSAVTPGVTQRGTTLGGWTAPSPSVTPSTASPGVTPTSVSPDPSASTTTPSPSPDASPDTTPSGVSTSPVPAGSGMIGSP